MKLLEVHDIWIDSVKRLNAQRVLNRTTKAADLTISDYMTTWRLDENRRMYTVRLERVREANRVEDELAWAIDLMTSFEVATSTTIPKEGDDGKWELDFWLDVAGRGPSVTGLSTYFLHLKNLGDSTSKT